MKKHYIFLTMLFLTAALMCSVCGNEPERSVEFDRETFERERAAWIAQGITKYQYEQYTFDGVPPSCIRMIAVNGNGVTVEISPNSRSGGPWDRDVITIPEIYDFIERLFYEANNEVLKDESLISASFDIRYNSQYHYPEKLSYYRTWKYPHDINTYGGESVIAVENFRVLKFEKLMAGK